MSNSLLLPVSLVVLGVIYALVLAWYVPHMCMALDVHFEAQRRRRVEREAMALRVAEELAGLPSPEERHKADEIKLAVWIAPYLRPMKRRP